MAEQNILLEKHLSEGTTLYLDSTNVEFHVRADLVELAWRHGRTVVALRFLPHLDTCRARNRTRPANRRAPDDVLAWQYSLAATPKALLAEGFAAARDIVTIAVWAGSQKHYTVQQQPAGGSCHYRYEHREPLGAPAA